MPTFVDLEEVAWTTVHALLAAYPHLPLVLTGVTYRIDRSLFALWQDHANLYVEISGYQGYHGIEQVVARFGAGRLLFGTHAPVFAPGAAITLLGYAAVDADARARIAAGNLHSLLEAAYA